MIITLHLGLPGPPWHPAPQHQAQENQLPLPLPGCLMRHVTLCTKLDFKTHGVSAKSGFKRRTSQAQNRGRQISSGENSHPASGQARGVL